MTYTLDRFEDHSEGNRLAVLELDTGESLTVPRARLPLEAREGDVLEDLPWYDRDGEVCYRVDVAETEKRKREAADLRASLPRADEGDLEL